MALHSRHTHSLTLFREGAPRGAQGRKPLLSSHPVAPELREPGTFRFHSCTHKGQARAHLEESVSRPGARSSDTAEWRNGDGDWDHSPRSPQPGDSITPGRPGDPGVNKHPQQTQSLLFGPGGLVFRNAYDPGPTDPTAPSPRGGSAWATCAPHRDAAHGVPESGAKTASSISGRLHESPTPPDKHLSGAFREEEQMAKINALFSPCSSWEWFQRMVWGGKTVQPRLAGGGLGRGPSLAEPQFPHL